MIFRFVQFSIAVLVIVSFNSQINAQQTRVFNVDFNRVLDADHSGDDGVMSTSGGTYWNTSEIGLSNLLRDEFGNFGHFAMNPWTGAVQSSAFGATSNDLQDSGYNSGGGGATFHVSGFNPTDIIDVALYMDPNTIIDVETGAGNFVFDNNGGPYSGVLPGNVDGDYVLISGLTPTASNELIFGGNGHDGVVTGAQFRVTSVPEPSSVVLLGSVAALLFTRRRRS